MCVCLGTYFYIFIFCEGLKKMFQNVRKKIKIAVLYYTHDVVFWRIRSMVRQEEEVAPRCARPY